jgi:hypothetical protein
LQAKDDIIGTGLKFDRVVRNKQIVLFIGRKRHELYPDIFEYKYILGDRVEHAICDEERFRNFFKLLYLSPKQNENCHKNQRRFGKPKR